MLLLLIALIDDVVVFLDPTLLENNSDAVTGRGSDIIGRGSDIAGR